MEERERKRKKTEGEREKETEKKERKRKSCPQTREDILESHTYIFLNQSQNIILPVVESMQSWWKQI